MRLRVELAVALGVLAAPQLASARLPALQPVSFASCANESANIGGPVGTSQGNAGTNFAFLTFNLLDPAAGNNIWVGAAGASLHISLSVPSPTAVYFVINTVWGQPSVVNATILLNGTGGIQQAAPLKGGKTIRDFNNGTFTDTLTAGTSQEWWTNNLNPMPQDGSHREDVHKIDTSKTFAGQTLTEIVIAAPKNAGVNFMEPLLFAIGVQSSSGPITATCTAS